MKCKSCNGTGVLIEDWWVWTGDLNNREKSTPMWPERFDMSDANPDGKHCWIRVSRSDEEKET